MSRAELVRTLAACLESPSDSLAPAVSALGMRRPPTVAEHTEAFTFQLHPYASVQLGPEGQLGGVARDRVAGFFRALNVVPPSEPDHLLVLLSAYAELAELDDGDDSRARHARTALLHEHLQPWVPRFLLRVTELAADPYRQWAVTLTDVLAAEVELLGESSSMPAHLRDAPALPDPRDGDASTFLAGILAPVRSGMILARADLARAGSALGLGVRIGERAFMLRSLLAQDATATLSFLAGEARRQALTVTGSDLTAQFWQRRLTTSAAMLAELAASSAEGVVTDQGTATQP